MKSDAKGTKMAVVVRLIAHYFQHLPKETVIQTKPKPAADSMNHFTTLTQAMEDLRQRGYTGDFAPDGDYLKVTSTGTAHNIRYKSDDITVDEFHRFEGTSDPGDEMTLYAISCLGGMKGVFVSAQGTYSNEVSAELMAKFDMSHSNQVNTDGAVQSVTPGENYTAG